MRTKLLVESSLGDLLKVVAVQLDDLLEKDRLQVAEIISLVKSRLLSLELPRIGTTKSRPKATRLFMKNYHSGNFYTLTKSKHEKNTKDRLDLIIQCSDQSHQYDGLTRNEFYTLCETYIHEHFSDGEDVGPELPDFPKRGKNV